MDDEAERNIHQEEAWSEDASFWLLQLRFKLLSERFERAQTVAAVHEVWGVLARRINGALRTSWNAVECSDQLSRLRELWETRGNIAGERLLQQMKECFEAEETPQSADLLATASLGVQFTRDRVETEVEVAEAEEEEEIIEPPRKKQATERDCGRDISSPMDDIQESFEPDVRGLPREEEILVALERRKLLLVERDRLQQQEAELTQKVIDAVASRG